MTHISIPTVRAIHPFKRPPRLRLGHLVTLSPCHLVIFLLVGCQPTAPARPRLGEVDRLPRVETVPPEYASRETRIEVLATVEALEKVRLCAQVQGEVKGLSSDIDIGRPVRKDEPLVTLDVPALEAELANKKALLALANNLKAQAE